MADIRGYRAHVLGCRQVARVRREVSVRVLELDRIGRELQNACMAAGLSVAECPLVRLLRGDWGRVVARLESLGAL